MAKSIGEALATGAPVVFTFSKVDKPVCQVVCVPGKEQEALELLHKMKVVELLRPELGVVPSK